MSGRLSVRDRKHAGLSNRNHVFSAESSDEGVRPGDLSSHPVESVRVFSADGFDRGVVRTGSNRKSVVPATTVIM